VALLPEEVTFDCAEPVRVAAFWAAAVSFPLEDDPDADEAYLPDPSERTGGLYFQSVPEPKVGKNRVHLDLRPAHTMDDEVGRLEELGASSIRVVRERAVWTVMGDVEGNEFCVLQGPEEGAERTWPGIDSLVVDCTDPFRVAAFWLEALGYWELERGASGIEIGGPREGAPILSFVTVPEPKTVKNRLHLDVRPTGTMAEEVARLGELGATKRGYIEIAASVLDDRPSFWTQMRDIEGNEFCVLRGPGDGWVRDEL